MANGACMSNEDDKLFDGENKRHARRKQLPIYLRVTNTGDDAMVGYLADITSDGVLLVSNKAIEPGQSLVLELEVGAGQNQLRSHGASEEDAEHIRLHFESRWSQAVNAKVHKVGLMRVDDLPKEFPTVEKLLSVLKKSHLVLDFEPAGES